MSSPFVAGDLINYGVGGGDRKVQFLCFLYLNNINEKIFTLLWFWLHALAAVAGERRR